MWTTHPLFTLHLLDTSQRHGVDPRLAAAVIKQESGWNPTAQSYVGAKGLMQIMPANWGWMGLKTPSDPFENTSAGIAYLGQLLNRYKGDEKAALAHYNGGPGAVRYLRRTGYKLERHKSRQAWGNQTSEYVTKIMRIYQYG